MRRTLNFNKLLTIQHYFSACLQKEGGRNRSTYFLRIVDRT